VRVKTGVVAIEGRAIGAYDLMLVPHIEENMRMIKRRFGTDAHELMGADLDYGYTEVIVKMGNDVIRHVFCLAYFGECYDVTIAGRLGDS
jgi:hypothetical protein